MIIFKSRLYFDIKRPPVIGCPTIGGHFIRHFSRRFYFENDACLYLNAFYKKIKDIYNISHLRSSSAIEKKIAILSPQAKNIWISFYNEIEQLIGIEILSDIRDYALKIANNVARVATLIHYFEHDNDEVCDLCM